MEDVGIFYGHLVHFCYILWTFGVVRKYLVHFFQFGYFVRRKIWQPWPTENIPLTPNIIFFCLNFLPPVFANFFGARFSTIFNYFQLFSTIFNYFQLFSTIFNYFLLFSTIFNYFQLFSTIFNYFQLFSTIFNYFQLFSTIFYYFLLFSTIFNYFQLFSTIFYLLFLRIFSVPDFQLFSAFKMRPNDEQHETWVGLQNVESEFSNDPEQ
jgi:hypothetical protein